jgi:hypothetical protein
MLDEVELHKVGRVIRPSLRLVVDVMFMGFH